MTGRILTPAEASSIQLALNEHGANLEVDGHYGALTQKALLSFQHENGLPESGTPDLVTTSALGISPIVIPPAPQPRKDYPMDTVLANVKSAWLSKLNWTVALGVVFNIFMFIGHPVPPDVQAAVVSLGNSLVLVAAWIIKTWFTTSITAASAKKL